MYGIFAALALSISCAGYGQSLLTLLGGRKIARNELEWFVFCFTAGQGILGWILFFPGVLGYFSYNLFIVLLVIGFLCNFFFFSTIKENLSETSFNKPHLSKVHIFIITVILLITIIDIFEATAPPADADTLEYHFALPKKFLNDGAITFFPRAIEAAAPLLIHMTYAAALQIGGESGLTFWTLFTGWNTSLFVYFAAKRYLPTLWATLTAVTFLCTPVVLYVGGSGHLEIRCTAFALASVIILIESYKDTSLKFVLLAGLYAGFFVASKYYGLIFALSSIPVILFQNLPIKRIVIYLGVIFLVGFQWYFWNFIHTNDPIFPTLTNLLQYPASDFWDQEYGYSLSETLGTSVPITFLNWLLFPIIAFLNLIPDLDSGRTGFGIFIALIFPMTIVGIFRYQSLSSKELIPLVVVVLFFTIWFFSGTSQRVRHLLPVYPFILITFVAFALSFSNRFDVSNILAYCFIITIGIQIAGQMLFGFNYAKFFITGEERHSFIERNVSQATVVHWANKNLPPETRVAYRIRGIAYLFNNHPFMLHPRLQKIIDSRPSTHDSLKFVNQLQGENITHLILKKSRINVTTSEFQRMMYQLVHSGCFSTLKEFEALSLPSRTLKSLGQTKPLSTFQLLKINYNSCREH